MNTENVKLILSDLISIDNKVKIELKKEGLQLSVPIETNDKLVDEFTEVYYIKYDNFINDTILREKDYKRFILKVIQNRIRNQCILTFKDDEMLSQNMNKYLYDKKFLINIEMNHFDKKDKTRLYIGLTIYNKFIKHDNEAQIYCHGSKEKEAIQFLKKEKVNNLFIDNKIILNNYYEIKV